MPFFILEKPLVVFLQKIQGNLVQKMSKLDPFSFRQEDLVGRSCLNIYPKNFHFFKREFSGIKSRSVLYDLAYIWGRCHPNGLY